MMLQSSLLMGGRLDVHDRFRDWRLDVDHMSYEVSSSQSIFDDRLFNLT